jgi:uncharacterized protein DUF6804
MFTAVTKSFSAAALLAAALWEPTAANRLLLELVVFAGAIIVAVQAIRMRRHAWALGFAALALLFNPVIAIPLSSAVLRWLELICAVSFLMALVVLKPAPLRSAPSITDWHPRGESL